MSNQNTRYTSRNSARLKGVLLTFFLTCFVAATYGFGIYLFAVLVSSMRVDLEFNYTTIGLLTAGGQIGFLSFSILGGILTPIIGVGAVIFGSAALCGTCLLLLGFTSKIWVLGTFLTVLGGCAASGFVPLVTAVRRFIGYNNRGKALGIISSGTSYGVFINGVLAPRFIAQENWRGMWVCVGLGTLLVVGLAILTFSKVNMLDTFMKKEKRQKKVKSGFSYQGLISRKVVLICTITFFNNFALLPFQNYLTPFLQDELGFSASFIGQIWTILGLIGMGAGFVLGMLSDRFGVRAAMVLAYLLILLAALLLILPSTQTSLVFTALTFGLGFYPIYGLVPAYLGKTCREGEATAVFGIANFTQGLGGVIGNFLAGVTGTVTGSFLGVYVAIGISALVLVYLTLSLPRETQPVA